MGAAGEEHCSRGTPPRTCPGKRVPNLGFPPAPDRGPQSPERSIALPEEEGGYKVHAGRRRGGRCGNVSGGILSTAGSAGPPSKGAQKRQVQVESLQNKLLEDLLKRVEILEKKETKMLYELDRLHKDLAFLTSGLKQPES